MINANNEITNSVINATFLVWNKFLWLIPTLVVAALLVIVGWMISVIIGKGFEKILNKLHVNKFTEEIGLDRALSEINIKSNVTKFLGEVVKWFLAIVFFMAAADALNLSQLTSFLNAILLYVPNIIAAIVILAVGMFVANILNKLIHKSASLSGVVSPDVLGSLAKWAILIFAVMAALVQLHVAQRLIETLFTGIVIMLALAGGLAFGLGGKDKAKDLLDKMDRR